MNTTSSVNPYNVNVMGLPCKIKIAKGFSGELPVQYVSSGGYYLNGNTATINITNTTYTVTSGRSDILISLEFYKYT